MIFDSSRFKRFFQPDDDQPQPVTGNDEDSVIRRLAPLLPEICVAAARYPWATRSALLARAEKLTNDGGFVWAVGGFRVEFGKLPWDYMAQSLRRQLVPEPLIGAIEKLPWNFHPVTRKSSGPLSRLLREYYLFNQLDRIWQEQYPNTALLRFRNQLLIPCNSTDGAHLQRRALSHFIKATEMPQLVSPRLSIRHIEDAPASFLGLRAIDGAFGLEWHLGEAAWKHLDWLLIKARAHSNPSKQVGRTIAGWILLVSPSYVHTNFDVTHAKITAVFKRNGIKVPNSRAALQYMWQTAYQRYADIRKKIVY